MGTRAEILHWLPSQNHIVMSACVCMNVITLTHRWGPNNCLHCNPQKVNTKTGEVSDTPVAMMDVYQEFNEISEKFKIMKFKSKVGTNTDNIQ